MRVLDTFDHAFHVLKTQSRVIAVLLLPLLVPIHLLQAYVGRDSVDDTILDFFGTPGLFVRSLDGHEFALTAYVLNLLVLSVSGVLVAHMLARWLDGSPPEVRSVAAASPRLILRALVAFVAVHAIQAMSLVLAPFVIPFLCIVSPIIGFENRGPFAAIKRSFALTRPHYTTACGFALFSALIVFILGLLFGWLPSTIASALGDDNYGWVVGGVASVAYATISTAFVAIASSVFYLDLRVRREGLDIERDLAEVFGE